MKKYVIIAVIVLALVIIGANSTYVVQENECTCSGCTSKVA